MTAIQFDASGAQTLFNTTSADWLTNLDTTLETIQNIYKEEDNDGYNTLVKKLRAWTWCHKVPSDHHDYASFKEIAEVAEKIRAEAKILVIVGIGGSDLGGRTIHDLLDHPFHNDLVREGKIQNVPEVYFTGDTFDPVRLRGLLEMLEARNLLGDTVLNIISKSGTTAETALAGMIIADKLGPNWMQKTVATTGKNSASLLYQMQENNDDDFMAILPVPDGVGGRFSFACPVGSLLLAVTAVDCTPEERLNKAMEGYKAAHDSFLNDSVSESPAYQIAKFLHVSETMQNKNSFVFYPYFDNRKLCDWFVQLYEESVQERGSGLNVLLANGPTGNHSLLNGIVNGARDKSILFLIPDSFGDEMAVPENAPLAGSLKLFQGISLEAAQRASYQGTSQDFTNRMVPNATITFPKRDEASVFGLMRVLMDAVAIKGCLQSLHINPISGERLVESETYIQTGVEGYKKCMRENIK